MRSPSSALVMAANQTSAIGVLFDVDQDVIVRNGCFQRGTTLKFLKYFRTFFVSILGQRHGVIIPVKPIRMQPQSGGKSIFCASNMVCLLVFALSSHAGSLLPLFTCVLEVRIQAGMCSCALRHGITRMTPPPPAAHTSSPFLLARLFSIVRTMF